MLTGKLISISKLIMAVALLISTHSSAQDEITCFEHLSVKDGLSQSTVNAIVQDRKGFMWFGTLNGLNRYDGYSFTDFRHNPADPGSISNDQILDILEDREGNLWVGTIDGLNRFDPGTQKFERFRTITWDTTSLSHTQVNVIYEDSFGGIWVGTGNGLNRYNSDTQTFRRFMFRPNKTFSLSSPSITALQEGLNGNLWIGTYAGSLDKLSPNREHITHFLPGCSGAAIQYQPDVIQDIVRMQNHGDVVAAITEVGDNQKIVRDFKIERASHFLLVASGEATRQLHDFGWLEQAGDTLWSMRLNRTRHAGGGIKNRIQGIPRLKELAPEADIIMLTNFHDDDKVFESLCAGATGYLLKSTPPQGLLASLREVSRGGAPMSASIARMVVGSFKRSPREDLTRRESEILAHLCQGKSYKMIADALFISPGTVHSHIKNIYTKLEVNSKSEAVAKALQEKLV